MPFLSRRIGLVCAGFLAYLVAASLSSSTAAAAAADGPIVVLVESTDPTSSARETSTRARAELGAAGFHVVVTTAKGSDTRRSLESAVAEAGAIAAIAIESDPNSTIAQVWVSDRLTRKLSVRPVETRGAGDTPALLAIRSVELLRASLIELRNPATEDHEAAPLAPAVAKLTAPRSAASGSNGSGTDGSGQKEVSGRSGWGFELGLAGILNVDPANPAMAPVLRASYGSKMGIGARVTWIGPSIGRGLRGDLGKASLTQELAVGEIVFAPPLPRPFVAQASGGIGVYHVSASGDLTNPHTAKSGGVAAFAASIGAGGGVRLSNHFVLGAEVLAGFTAPKIVIDMGAQRVGSLGQPILGLTTTLGAFF